jgi:Cu2+-exporting ATPase
MEHDMSTMFLRRFYIVSILLIPLFVFSKFGIGLLGFGDFALRIYIEFIIATAIFYFSLVFFDHAKHEIKSRQFGMMTLVSMGVGAGYLFSAAATFIPSLYAEFYLEISTLIWILLFGHYLEAKSSTAAGDALSEVAKLLPKTAHLKKEKTVVEVKIEELKKTDVVLVKAGEKVPADGIIISGDANFNEAHISGESKPVNKKVNDKVSAGAINIDGSVEVRLTRVGDDSTIGQIQNLIRQAKATKPSAQKLADRASKWLTFTAIGVALVTLVVWSAMGQPLVFGITLAITVLVIACPHALGLAIPTVSTIATRLAVKNGVFIKDMGKIEVVKSVNYVVFDKTGTLTQGKFGVSDLEVFMGSKINLLSIAGSIESESSHVIGFAISEYAKKQKAVFGKVSEVKNLAGKGIRGEVDNKKYWIGSKQLMVERKVWSEEADKIWEKMAGKGETVVAVSDEKQIIGLIGLSDEIKKESKIAIQELHKLGIKVVMLTGDSKAASEPVAAQLGVDNFFAEVLPEDKYKYIKKLQKDGSVVLMAGDGVNDAPALTQANVGAAIGAGTDVAVEAGDMVLTQSNPQNVVGLIILAKKVYRKMQENLVWALGYNVLAIPAAAGLFIPLGFRLTPAIGALLMSLSSVIVVINAMSLRSAKLEV